MSSLLPQPGLSFGYWPMQHVVGGGVEWLLAGSLVGGRFLHATFYSNKMLSFIDPPPDTTKLELFLRGRV
jgi:hypothetical protein